MSNKNLTNPTTEEMEREVYEATTGKCAHEWERIATSKNTLEAQFECARCHARVTLPNDACYPYGCPPLATSIDAWHVHIFPVMTFEQKFKHQDELVKIWERAIYRVPTDDAPFKFEATAMHHLTAAYNVVKGG